MIHQIRIWNQRQLFSGYFRSQSSSSTEEHDECPEKEIKGKLIEGKPFPIEREDRVLELLVLGFDLSPVGASIVIVQGNKGNGLQDEHPLIS